MDGRSPGSQIFTVSKPSRPLGVSGMRRTRFPAYSGGTAPDSHRLPYSPPPRRGHRSLYAGTKVKRPSISCNWQSRWTERGRFPPAFTPATAVGAVLTLWIGTQMESVKRVILPIAARNFLYIAASDLVPELHQERGGWMALWQVAIILIGIALMLGIRVLRESLA